MGWDDTGGASETAISGLQRVYSAYLEERGFAAGTVAAARNSAFYLLKNDPSLDFWAMLEREDFEAAAAERLRATLRQRGSRNVEGNLNGYLAYLRRFRRFVLSEEAEKRPAARKRREGPDIPTPCPEEVRRYLSQWHELENYRNQEEALDRLFQDYAPGNKDIRDILLKAAALNAFYSTNIFSLYPVAEHILALDIDQRLRAGDPSLVEDLKTVEGNGTVRRFYSFATKYCSHHRPEEFPIYDHYVAVTLRHFRDRDAFAPFQDGALEDYRRFREVLRDFRDWYGLGEFSWKELDRYLWQVGKEFFPRKYGKARPR